MEQKQVAALAALAVVVTYSVATIVLQVKTARAIKRTNQMFKDLKTEREAMVAKVKANLDN